MPHLEEMQKQSNILTLSAVVVGNTVKELSAYDTNDPYQACDMEETIEKLSEAFSCLAQTFEKLAESTIAYLQEYLEAYDFES